MALLSSAARRVVARLGLPWGEEFYASDQPPMMIGRAASFAEYLADPFYACVSRQHAQLSWRAGGLYLRPIAPATNGTWVDGRELPPDAEHRLTTDCRVSLSRRLTLSVSFAPNS
jgi:predicted component of type VI protein secretion system